MFNKKGGGGENQEQMDEPEADAPAKDESPSRFEKPEEKKEKAVLDE